MAKQNTKTKSEAKATETKAPQTVTLANIAREMGKNPKAVRARFRKLYADGNDTSGMPQPVKGGSRWTFAANDREALEKLVGATDDNGE